MKIYQLLPLVLVTGCAYRYGTGYFMNDVPVHRPPTVPTETPDPPPAPVASSEPTEEDCEQVLEKLEVTNKLDSKNNTITTTAVTKHERSKRCP